MAVESKKRLYRGDISAFLDGEPFVSWDAGASEVSRSLLTLRRGQMASMSIQESETRVREKAACGYVFVSKLPLSFVG